MPFRLSCKFQVGRKELELALGDKDLVLMTYWVALDRSQPEYNISSQGKRLFISLHYSVYVSSGKHSVSS